MIYKRRWYPNRRQRIASLGTKWMILLPLIAITFLYNYNIVGRQESEVVHAPGRHLLSSGAEWEQCDFEIGNKRNYSNPGSWVITDMNAYGYLAMHFVLVLIVFVGIAVICDDFFVPSLEAISEELNLSEDVAGATFMAAGSSAPELFTSIAGVTSESDIGVGTIVGSAVFNLLCICALSAVFAGSALELDWRPLCRDATFYGMSIVCFIIFSWDGQFDFWESCIMLALYILYIVLMKYNPSLMRLLSRASKKNKLAPVVENQPNQLTETTKLTEEEEEFRRFSRVDKGMGGSKASLAGFKNLGSNVGMNMPTIPGSKTDPVLTKEQDMGVKQSGPAEEEDYEDDLPTCKLLCMCPVVIDTPEKPDEGGCCAMFKYGFVWVIYIIAFPFIVMFTYTIPDCSTEKTRKWYPLSFLMSIIWIAALSFGMVTLVGRAGCILGIDKFTMGLVVVAIGTSLPDAMSSILVAKDGYGDMAVSNAIGSNVFDIDLGVGLPFVIGSAIRELKPVVLITPAEKASYEAGDMLLLPHPKFGFLLIILLFAALFIFAAAKFRLSKKLAISFVCMYFVFLAYAFVQELYCKDGIFC